MNELSYQTSIGGGGWGFTVCHRLIVQKVPGPAVQAAASGQGPHFLATNNLGSNIISWVSRKSHIDLVII